MQLSIALPNDAITAKPNGLAFTRHLTEREIDTLMVTLRQLRNNVDWYVGDAINALIDQGYSIPRPQQMELFDGANVAVVVCRSIPLNDRITNLTYAHHRTALEECGGNTKDALMWLARASEHGWKVSHLRHEIRQSARNEDDKQGNAIIGVRFRQLDKVAMWAFREINALPDYTPEMAREVLITAKPLHDYLLKLQSIASESQ